MKKRLSILMLLIVANSSPAEVEATTELEPIFGLRAGIADSYDPDRLAEGLLLEIRGGVAVSQKIVVTLSVDRSRHGARWLALREQEATGSGIWLQTGDLTTHSVRLNARPLLWAQRSIRPLLEVSAGLARWRVEEPLLEITTVDEGSTEETFRSAIVDWGGSFGVGIGFDVELAPRTRLEVLVNGQAVTHMEGEDHHMWGVDTFENRISFVAGIQRSW